jgi:3-hydroxyacyl-CoA dehydrogenase
MSVSYDIIRNVAVLSLKNPPVNGFSKSLRGSLLLGLKRAQTEGADAIVVFGSGSQFSAGADIKEFQVEFI